MSQDNQHLDIETLSTLIDRQGAAPARADAQRHLASCAQCAARKASLESAAKAVAGLAKVSPTPDETRAMRLAVLNARPRRWLAWWPAVSRRVLVAGTAVAAVLAGAVWLGVVDSGPPASSSASSAAAPRHLAPEARAGAPQQAAPLPGINSDVNPIPSPSGGSQSPIVTFNGEASTGGTLYVPSPGPAFSTEGQVASYIAGQVTVKDEAQALTAGSASIVNSDFLGSIGNTSALTPDNRLPPTPSASTVAPTPPAAGLNPFLVTSPSPAAGTAAGATTTAPAVPAPATSTLAQCVEQVVGYVPQPAAAIEATPITYRDTPAWLIVLATAPGTASPSPSQTLTVERFWVQTDPACTTLTAGTV